MPRRQKDRDSRGGLKGLKGGFNKGLKGLKGSFKEALKNLKGVASRGFQGLKELQELKGLEEKLQGLEGEL